MTLTPRNITTTDFLALAATAGTSRRALMIQVFDFSVRRWTKATDSAIIEAATAAAMPNLKPGMQSGERLFIGDLLGSRVCVEVW
jgi:hypothetical protein